MITFLLLLIGIVLLIFNFKALKNEKNTFKDAFDNASNNLKDYDVEIGKLRREFAETILELQQEIENMKYNKISIQEKQAEVLELEADNINSIVSKNGEEIGEDKKLNAESDFEVNNVKVNEIKEMLNDGLSIDSISEKLGIGKGELLLIEKLYLK
ncbi:DUF6115 domain-containing protein [Clostridium akagii]|uniref:DUF6115 domain-containing protein n=1 Tax=Clostridium akagii TaxID=91623 RepID=UPI00047D81D9|nr:hypothetical protein [Clostridium akagii]